MSSPTGDSSPGSGDRSHPPGRRRIRRADRARVVRRRRLFALVAAIVIVLALILVLSSLIDACRPDKTATSGAAGLPDGKTTLTATPSPAAWTGPPSSALKLKLRKTIVSADISPKSVVSSGTGYVFAQNMMYKHTITVYDSKTMKLVKTIDDAIDPARFHIKGHGSEPILGAPVEAAFLPDGRFAYVSQYSMYGPGYVEGHDAGSPGQASDSYVYRVSTADLVVDKVIKVGEVPKYVAVTPDSRYVLVSNWQSFTLSVIDAHSSKVVKTVSLGPYPRGIAVSPDSRTAYVAVMGTTDIAVVDLKDFSLSWISGVGSGPRHLCMAPDGKYLYATLNSEGAVAKIDPKKKVVVDKVSTGSEPRSMAIAPDGSRCSSSTTARAR